MRRISGEECQYFEQDFKTNGEEGERRGGAGKDRLCNV